MRAAPWPRRRWGRTCLLLVGGTLVWTLLVCYPNPAIFFRNLARYRHLPLDPQVERKMGWTLPEAPAEIEDFLDHALAPASDWEQYRVPWYVPAPREVAQSLKGDCEAKTILFASLLAGRGVPFEIRASFNHIWVDYAGRPEQPGERKRLAYLEGKGGRLGMHLPAATDWATFLAVEREMLWEEMPPLRRVAWAVGLAWLLVAALTTLSPLPKGEYNSRWRPGLRLYLDAWVGALLAQMLGLVLVLEVTGWSVRRDRLALSLEFTAAAVVVAWLATWLWVRFLPLRPSGLEITDGELISVASRAGLRRRRVRARSELVHLELRAPRHEGGPWTVSARTRAGGSELLLQYRSEVEARQVLVRLGRRLEVSVVVAVERTEARTRAEEIGWPLHRRTEVLARAPRARPPHLDLLVEDAEGCWRLRYPPTRRGFRWVLLGLALLPAGLFAAASLALKEFAPWRLAWIGWALTAAGLCTTICLLLVVRDEMVARLANVGVEIAEGRVRFHAPEGKVASVELEAVESVELGWAGGAPTIAVVTPTQVLHVRDLCAPEERPWVREVIAAAIVSAQERQASALVT